MSVDQQYTEFVLPLQDPCDLNLTQADLDNGLSPEQIQWLLANLNVKPLVTALRDIAERTATELAGIA